MKRKIICIGVVTLFLLVMFPASEATEIKSNAINKEAFNENNDQKTITVHTFYDNKDRNGIQGDDEENALNVYVWAAENWPFQASILTYKGQTNSDGNLTFTVPKDWTSINLYARQHQRLKLSQYKGVADLWSVQDGSYIAIPLKYYESVSAAKPTTQPILINILARLIDQFPLLQRLLTL